MYGSGVYQWYLLCCTNEKFCLFINVKRKLSAEQMKMFACITQNYQRPPIYGTGVWYLLCSTKEIFSCITVKCKLSWPAEQMKSFAGLLVHRSFTCIAQNCQRHRQSATYILHCTQSVLKCQSDDDDWIWSSLKGIVHQFFFYLIFWTVMGCGIADFGQRGL